MVQTVVNGTQIDRLKVLDELRSVIDSEDLEITSQVDREQKSFTVTFKVPVAEQNFESVSRLIAMSVDAAL